MRAISLQVYDTGVNLCECPNFLNKSKVGVNTDHVRRVEWLHDTPMAQSLSLFL